MRQYANHGAYEEIEILRSGVVMAIPGLAPTSLAQIKEDVDWAMVVRLGKASKILVQAASGLRKMEWTVPDEFWKAEIDYRRFILSMNSVNMRSIVEVSAMLLKENVPFILFKGPIMQNYSYNSYFCRPSSDVDILVDRKHIKKCSQVLREAEYFLPAECDRIWWKSFLGEQHFFSCAPNRATVDLHHRLQQPGCPHPRNIAAFLAEPHMHRLNGVDIPCISPIHATLLASMSFIKSLAQRCHSAAYLADFCALLLRLEEDERAELWRRAVEQRIENTVRFTLSCAADVYGLQNMEEWAPLYIRDLFGDDLLLAIFQPENPAIGWPRLRRTLWRLSDQNEPGQKLSTYLRVGGRFLASKIARKVPGLYPLPGQRPSAALPGAL